MSSLNGQVEENTGSKLSQTAQEVLPHLERAYTELRKKIKEGSNETLVSLANEIIGGRATESQRVDFKIELADARSRILLDQGLEERGKTIRQNYVDKLENTVLGEAS